MHTSDSTHFSSSQRTLFCLLAHSLFHRDVFLPKDTDWEAVLCEAQAQTVLSVAFCRSRDYEISETVMTEAKRLLRGLAMRDIVIHNGHTAIHNLLSQNGIPYVILKGAASAYYYPQTLLRGMGDVDFYVPPSHCETAIALLRANGFEESRGNEEIHHTGWKWRGIKFELHHDLPGIPKGPVGDRIRELFGSLITDSTLTKTDSATFVRPSAFHHGLILLLHTQQHLLCEGIGLRHICDWAVFVHGMGEDFTTLFAEALEELGLWRFARILSLVAVQAVGLPEAAWMAVDPSDRETSEELLHDVLDGGNFGVKDTDRSRVYESYLISGQNHQEMEHSRIRNAFTSVNSWVRNKWPAAKKCPLLLPFGWIYFLLHRMIGVMTGKKKCLRMKETLQNSRKRQRVYRRLGLFQPEPHTK